MKILKYFLFVLLIIFIAGSIYIATQDGDYQIEESRVNPAPTSLLFEEVNALSSWGKWSYWVHEEDNVISLSEDSSGEGAWFSWVNSDMGDGSVSTLEVIPEKSIQQELLLESSISDIKGNMYWHFEPS